MITGYTKTIVAASLPRPKWLSPILEPGFNSGIMRVSQSAGLVTPFGGAWDTYWSRHRYSKRQPWNSTGEYLLIDQKSTDGGSPAPGRFVIKTTGSSSFQTGLFGDRLKSGAAPAAGSPTAKLAAVREVQWRPNYPTQMVSYKRITSPNIGIEIEVFDVLTGATVGSVIRVYTDPPGNPGVYYSAASADLGWVGEGQISDDGRWTVFTTHLPDPQDNAANKDFCVVVDLTACYAGAKTDLYPYTTAIPNVALGAI